MAQEVQNGFATVFGIADSGSPISIEGYASFILDSAKADHKFELDAIKDEKNFDRCLVATNGHVEVSLTWQPAGATRADAASTAVILAPLSKVDLSNFKVSAFNGSWVYVGDCAIDLNQKHAKMSLKIRKYDDADQNASLTTTVVG